MNYNFNEKVCLVTGGSRSLGLEICKQLTLAGAKVAFTYSTYDNDASEAVKEISELGEMPLAIKGSVDDSKHVKNAVKEIIEKWGRIDVLINNAGINEILPFAMIDEEEWDLLINTNLKGAFLFSKAVIRHMIKQKSGKVLNLGSFASERFIESPVHYAAAKSGLRGLTEALALEVGRYGIQVNLLAPGILNTGMSLNIPGHRLLEYKDQSSLGRIGEVNEIADMALFMVSDDNSFMTGSKINIDGGL